MLKQVSIHDQRWNVVKNVLSEGECLLLATAMKVEQSIALEQCESEEERLEVLKGDAQVEGSFSKYASLGNEALLLLLNQKANEVFEEELDPTYSYARIYKNGNSMEKHYDRGSCSHSVSICLQKDKNNTPYPIYMNKAKVELDVGDAVFYHGNVVEHWRNSYDGEEHIQVFLHYSPKNSGFKYDFRPFVGLDGSYKNEQMIQAFKQHKLY